MTIWGEVAAIVGIVGAVAGFALHHIRLSILATVDRRIEERSRRTEALLDRIANRFMGQDLLEEKFRHIDKRFDVLEAHAEKSPKVMDDLQSVLVRLQVYERKVKSLLGETSSSSARP